MKIFYFILIGLFVSTSIVAERNYTEIEFPKSNEAIVNYITEQYQTIAGETFAIRYENKSLGGSHILMSHFYQDQRVLRSYIKIHLRNDGSIFFIDESLQCIEHLTIAGNEAIEKKRVQDYITAEFGKIENITSAWFAIDGKLRPVFDITVGMNQSLKRIILSHDLEILESRSMVYHANIDTLIKGRVFYPDPLTSAEQQYGGFYADNDDENNDALESQLFDVEFRAYFDTDNLDFTLDGQFLKIRMNDTMNPNIGIPVKKGSSLFLFSRDDLLFEAVNAYYHINVFQKYIQQLGFITIGNNDDLEVFPNFSEDDESYFGIFGSTPAIKFGLGGVDDAEDAEVVIHEYSHYLLYCASNEAHESGSRGFNEGQADYFASSYSYGITPYNKCEVFSWDGAGSLNPEIFSARDACSLNHYPEVITEHPNNEYEEGKVWLAVMMEILDELGKATTDSLMIQSLYYANEDVNLIQAAENLVAADEVLNNGENFNILVKFLHKRGLWNYQPNAGENVTICLGDSVRLGAQIVDLFSSNTTWTPDELLDENELKPLVSPGRTTTYIVRVEDYLYFDEYIDSITVFVELCPGLFDEVEDVMIYNTDRYLNGGDAYLVWDNDTEVESYRIWNSQGQLLYSVSDIASPHVIQGINQYYGTGVYFVEVVMVNQLSKVLQLIRTE